MFTRKQLLDFITHELSRVQLYIENINSLHLFDANVIAEDFFAAVLNGVYSLSLQNLNHKHLNKPAIDLGDSDAGVAFQVTSQNHKKKIQETLKKFVAHGIEKDYNKLKVLIIGRRTGDYPALDVPESFSFDGKRDVIDIRDLLKDVSSLELPRLKKIVETLKEHLSDFNSLDGNSDKPELLTDWAYDRSSEIHHFNLFPFDNPPIEIRQTLVEPLYSIIVDDGSDIETGREPFYKTAIEILETQSFLFLFGGYGAGKSVVSKNIQLKVGELGWNTSFAKAFDLGDTSRISNFLEFTRQKPDSQCLLIVDGLDETFLLKRLDTKGNLVAHLLKLAKEENVCVLVNSRYVPAESTNKRITASEFLEDLTLTVSDELQLQHCFSLQLEPYNKKKLQEWLTLDFERRGIENDSAILNTVILKRKRNNLLHSCYNPLFAYIFADRFYEEDESFDDIYRIYEAFVDKTIRGKFAAESKVGSRAIKQIVKEYRTLVQEMAVSVASLNEFEFAGKDLEEWRIDSNRKRYVVPHDEVGPIINELAHVWISKDQLSELSHRQIKSNVLSCYFFEEEEAGWRFRDNNIVFFLLAEVLLEDLTEGDLAAKPSDPLTKVLGRLARCSQVPIHPVAVRMWLSRLRRLTSQERKRLSNRLVTAYRDGVFLTNSIRSVENPTNEFRLELYLALAVLHLQDDGFANIGDFFMDLERLSLNLSTQDEKAFNVLRASVRGARIADANWEMQNLSGFNFSDCELVNTKFIGCRMKDLDSRNLRGSKVVFDSCLDLTKFHAHNLSGEFCFSNCKIVKHAIEEPGDLSLCFVDCRHVEISIRGSRKSTDKANVTVVFDRCRSIQKSAIVNVVVPELIIKDSKFNTFNVKGSRISHRIENSKFESRSKKIWLEDSRTKLYEL